LSHSIASGTIRLSVADAEAFYERVRIGTVVFIVAGEPRRP